MIYFVGLEMLPENELQNTIFSHLEAEPEDEIGTMSALMIRTCNESESQVSGV